MSRAVRGQASVLLVGGLAGVLLVALILGAVERALAHGSAAQRAADLAALAGARVMHANYMRLFEPPLIGDEPNPAHLEKSAYLAMARAEAQRVARANRETGAVVSFPDVGTLAPVRIRVAIVDKVTIRRGRAHRAVELRAVAHAELAPPAGDGLPPGAEGGGYSGPFAYRQGKPMRPDVAQAFDRLDRAARAAGVALEITSAYRSDAEQAELFRQHPDPKWVAPPGQSLHRYGTELDLGPKSAYGWLAANAPRFHFIRRYAWEPWHYGYTLNPRSTRRPIGGGADRPLEPGSTASGHGAIPGFVPPRYAPLLVRAAQRWNVSAALLAAQLYAESGFNPFAVSSAGAQGIAQFMPGTARAYGLANPFDAARAIDAQAHLMRDLLRQFGSVALALAAYNAGPGAVAACGCIPDNGETPGYVARIIGLMSGAGEPITSGPAGGLIVRLVR